MSKFFDATQRAAGVEIDPDLEVLRRSKRPNLFQEPIQTVEMEDEELPLSAEALQDDVLFSPSDDLVSSTDAVASTVGISNSVPSPEVPFEVGELKSEAETSLSENGNANTR